MSSFRPGDLIGGRYRLQRIIGAGAMGTVWSARNESTDRDFALKLMLPEAAKNPIALQRFFQEAKASGRLRHRSIVEVYDLGRIEQGAHAGTPYLVMELLEGEPLDSLLRRQQRLPIGTALRLVRDLARGLDVAHQQGIVHRDLKPANVFLHKTLDGTIVPKVLDFGVSKLLGATAFDAVETSAGTVLGSPAYMSPEQASGDANVDGRSDVWSLGVILYKCLAGNVPFSAPNYNALIMAIATRAHPPIESQVEGLPPDVSVLVDRCLTKERDERFESAIELAGALDRLLAARATLEHVALEELVVVHQHPPILDRTFAPQEQAGTLVATELERPATAPLDRTRAIDAEPPASTTAPREVGRVRVLATSFAIAAVLAMVVFVVRPRPAPVVAPTAAASAAPPATSAVSSVSSAEPIKSASPAPSPSASTSAKPKPKLGPRPKATPKPAHEGVTTSGF